MNEVTGFYHYYEYEYMYKFYQGYFFEELSSS